MVTHWIVSVMFLCELDMSSKNAFDQLAPFVQEFVYRLGWQELRELQALAISAIFDSDNDILITTGTASGKTEAAFLPILSLIAQEPMGSIKAVHRVRSRL